MYEEESEESFKLWSPTFFIVIITIAFMFFFKGRLGIVELDPTLILLIASIFLPLYINGIWASFLNKTRKVIHFDGFSTYTGELIEVEGSNNMILKLGGIRALGTEFHLFKKGVAIIPKTAIEPVGPSIVLHIDKVKKLNINEIEDEVIKSYLIKNKVQGPYYVCEDSGIKKSLRKPDLKLLIKLLNEKRQENSILERILDSLLEGSEKIVSSAERIKDLASTRKLIEELERLRKEREEYG